ncbi:alpha-1,3-mannosyl-glycoprotein 4-beta-N-acetylglucosaminyltransferase C-like [Erinaceus europaeus]|uniref:Alpha-1,3-mannosyl-glycoprotein 4-beta-N-acetylglucosaminyltransferase C-like n=1 Tax=Erinaceus europaeus TaxID=9365 RepID=A0ABM3WF26_ERIEU|nr:alpha-1,3-mannosyl-glycoprotein 4-beta-N-acetylglucosaminyltransferase C-like [Erinaceus europaeus]
MKCSLWKLSITIVTMVFSILCFIQENPFDTTSFLSLEEKKMVAWQRARMQTSPGRTNYLETFKEMQKNSELLKSMNASIFLGAPPVTKKLLTIGISMVPPPQDYHLVDTLQSLFFASTSSEQKHFIVLVHLAGLDPTRLDQMTSSLTVFFEPYLQARQLVVINTPLQSYLQKNGTDTPAHVAFYSKQNMDYAILMNFATNHSDYFLMIKDAVKCTPGFVTHIASTVSALKNKLWVTLEFSQLGFTGKLFRTKDLPQFVHFLLLFYQEMTCDCLLAHFHDLVQQEPIQFFPPLFRPIGNYSSFSGNFGNLKEKEFEENGTSSPSNPKASIYTNLKVANGSAVTSAYSLDKNFFSVREAEVGSHLTVVLDIPAEIFRVQVLTGSDLRENRLEEGQVELGYDSTNLVTDCDDYVLLGLLVDGTLNKEVLSCRSGKKVKCVRLLVTATSPSKVIIRNINLWVN